MTIAENPTHGRLPRDTWRRSQDAKMCKHGAWHAQRSVSPPRTLDRGVNVLGCGSPATSLSNTFQHRLRET
jgi:hypothetical protein